MSNPGVVRKLLDARGLSQAQLAERTGIEPTKLSKSLNNKRRFSLAEMSSIAEALDVTLDQLAAEPSTAPAFALRTSTGKADTTAVKLAEYYLALAEGYRDVGLTQPVAGFTSTVTLGGRFVDQGAALAKEALQHMKAHHVDVSNLPRAIELAFGVDVAVQDLGGGFDGLACSKGPVKFIIVGRTRTAYRQRFTMAHELGHLLSGDDQGIVLDHDVFAKDRANNDGEVRANAFAAALIMPEDTLRQRVDAATSDDELCALAMDLRVSPSALSYRLLGLGIVDERRQRQLVSIRSQEAAQRTGKTRQFREDMVSAHRLRPPTFLTANALQLFTQGEATIRPYAELIGADPHQLRAELEGNDT